MPEIDPESLIQVEEIRNTLNQLQQELQMPEVDSYRVDEVVEYSEKLADYAFNYAIVRSSKVGNNELDNGRLTTFTSTLINVLNEVLKTSDLFLTDQEFQIVVDEFENRIKEHHLNSGNHQSKLQIELERRFVLAFYDFLNPKTEDERIEELRKEKEPFNKERKRLSEILKESYKKESDTREKDLIDFSHAFAFDQIYEIEIQFINNGNKDDFSLEGMFGHLVNSLVTFKLLASSPKRGYLSLEEISTIANNVKQIIHKHFEDNQRYLDIFDKVFDEVYVGTEDYDDLV